jgi:sugar-specific transcriptional regulator TrmB
MDFSLNTLLDVSDDSIVDIAVRDLPQKIRDSLRDVTEQAEHPELITLGLNLSQEIALRMCEAIDEGNKVIELDYPDTDEPVLTMNWLQRIVFSVFFTKGGDYVI